jgi:hypothetical protein
MRIRIIAVGQPAPRGQFVEIWHPRIFPDHILKALVLLHYNDYVAEDGYLRLLSHANILGMKIKAETCD